MSRVRAFLDRIDDPSLPPLPLGDPRDAPLLALLVHLATVDGQVHGDEFALLQRLRPDLEPGALLTWVSEVAAAPLDLDAIVAATSSVDERWDVLRLAARMVGMDGELDQEEAARLGELARKLGLPVDAARRSLEDVIASAGAVTVQQVRDGLRTMRWRGLTPSHRPLDPALAGRGPEGQSLCTMWTAATGTEESDPVAAVYPDGLWAVFDEGPAWIRWVDLRHYTRVPVPHAAFHLRTWDDRLLSATDEHMRDLGVLIDRIYGRAPADR